MKLFGLSCPEEVRGQDKTTTVCRYIYLVVQSIGRFWYRKVRNFLLPRPAGATSDPLVYYRGQKSSAAVEVTLALPEA